MSAPQLVSAFPTSLTVLPPSFDGQVEFRFNEVVSEGSQPSQGLGTGDLEKLVLLSPTDRVPEVHWHRRRITVRPSEGWKPNRVYRVELLPGISDVRRNVSKAETLITFTTGAPVPADTLRGSVIDWVAGHPASGALVEAVLEPDSLPYRVLADSSGRFVLGPIPSGEYVVFGVLDQNHNFRRDEREAFDTMRVLADSGTVGALYAFVHDTLPPRIANIQPTDSVTATIMFAQPLDPTQRLDTSMVIVRRLPDSARVAAVSLSRPDTAARTTPSPERTPGAPGARADTLRRELGGALDSLARRRGAIARGADSLARRIDSLAHRADTAARAVPPAAAGPTLPARPPLSDRLTLKVAEPWHPGDKLEIALSGIRTVSGIAGDVLGVLAIPQANAGAGVGAPSAAQPADSLNRASPSDTTRADSTRADSARAVPRPAPAPPDSTRPRPR
ncbi:MAG TPA: Ig-like domain-containing protein [Gemmatimonadales bacterium]|nr:Ig-like domain-containing protein [Gemmatimonadales bacterium]